MKPINPLRSLRWRRNKNIVFEMPLMGRGRGQLADLPLTVDDWRAVWFAMQAFRAQVRLIADHVIERELAKEALKEKLLDFKEEEPCLSLGNDQ